MSIRGGDPHADGRLAAVLRAATAPAHQDELAGEGEALAAFRAAANAPRRRSLLTRILTVKALVIGSVAASTGVVLAAAGGALPVPWDERPAGPAPEPPAVTTSLPAGTSSAGDPPRVSEPATGETPAGPESTESVPPLPEGDDRSHKGDKNDKGDRGGKSGNRQSAPPITTTNETPPAQTEAPSGRSRTPDSAAPGAVTAAPPSGAAPPAEGS
jgi:hypothetical protein